MSISVFEIFKIGIGPSSSHTVGPMRAAKNFVSYLQEQDQLKNVVKVIVDLYGSLALTGKGHGTDKAVIMGLTGEQPDTIEASTADARMLNIIESQSLPLNGSQSMHFNYAEHIIFHFNETLPKHVNGLRFSAYDAAGALIFSQVFYSIGGGFIVTEEQFGMHNSLIEPPPYPFETAAELLAHCRKNNLSIAELMLENEKSWRTEAQIREGLLKIATIMEECIEHGIATTGFLPGGLNVPRRAPGLYKKIQSLSGTEQQKHANIMNSLNVFAMAVNEENAAGGKIVTAPTNGAAGIIPAVLQYYKKFCAQPTDEGIITFLLTAAAIAILYKLRASISGAEVGCQGEVGVACSMASGALAATLGGTLAQVENAAEIGMEHNLGLPCDPVKGLVQIPCIERNAMGTVKAVNAAYLALAESGEHKISLDAVIATMNQIGKDMSSIYKETSLGGLAVNITEC